MSRSINRYQQFATSGVGGLVAKRLGLPIPTHLRRYKPGQALLDGPALIGAAEGGKLLDTVRKVLAETGTGVHSGVDRDSRYGAFVFDASGITDVEQLHQLYAFFHPIIRRLGPSGRVVVLGTTPETLAAIPARVAQRGLEGFVRTVGKELKRGATAQLIYVNKGAEAGLEAPLRFVLSAKSAFVDGQVIRVDKATIPTVDWDKPLAGKVALVTGASRGIGAAIAETLARDGAHVVALDIPAQGDYLSKVANKINGATLQLDITSPEAADRIIKYFQTRHGGLDILVHNAGITRDKTLANMTDVQWNSVIAVNLACQLRVNEAILSAKLLRDGGRIIGVSSIAGIAGNVGQANYATTKAGVIGMVNGYAPKLAKQNQTINAVAPGFIETQMTAAVPLFIREAGRLMSSLQQGGLPVDVAETIAFYANPASAGVNGNVVRVCGQGLIGA
jgi:3-oxoacyl-[acyl-carrier protein] reductase